MKMDMEMDKRKNISKKLLSKRGETIMETLVSLLIMGILITSLLSIIRFSLVLTGDSLKNAAESQNDFNALTHGTVASGAYSDSATLSFTIKPLNPEASNIIAGQEVNLSANEAIPAAFIPKPQVGEGNGNGYENGEGEGDG